jgi:tetratricopeptide (TPR) repeat protein
MELKINKIFYSLGLIIIFAFFAWYFVIRIFLADYYYQEIRKAQDWPQILKYYEKVFSLNPQEPFYHQKLANDLKWGLQFYQQQEIKTQIIDLAITQMEKIKESERSFETRIDLAQLYLLKASLTKTDQDFLKAEQSFQKVMEMSPQVAKTYIYWCQLRIEEEKWDEAEAMCQKALSLYPSLSDSRLISVHRQTIQSALVLIYEKLGEIYLVQEKYSQAEQAFRQVLKFSLSPPLIWPLLPKKIIGPNL